MPLWTPEILAAWSGGMWRQAPPARQLNGVAHDTRAIQPGEDVRAGRWWWENPESKECGLHVVDGKLIRIKSVAA